MTRAAPRKLTNVERDIFTALWRAGVKTSDIGAHFDRSATWAKEASYAFGLPQRGRTQMTLAKYRTDLVARVTNRAMPVSQDELLARAMARDASAEQRQFIMAEMVDCDSTGRPIGMLKGAAA